MMASLVSPQLPPQREEVTPAVTAELEPAAQAVPEAKAVMVETVATALL